MLAPSYILPPLPAFEPDAAANDRFDMRLTRARLAVVHRSSSTKSTSTPRNVVEAAQSVAFDRSLILNEQRP